MSVLGVNPVFQKQISLLTHSTCINIIINPNIKYDIKYENQNARHLKPTLPFLGTIKLIHEQQ